MSAGGTLRVTPVELAGVAAQVRALALTMHSGSAALRSAVAGIGPPDPVADHMLVLAARATQAALTEVSDLLGSLLANLGRALDQQATALAGAAHGYAYVERQIAAALRPGERPHE